MNKDDIETALKYDNIKHANLTNRPVACLLSMTADCRLSRVEHGSTGTIVDFLAALAFSLAARA
jgi:hypothetical protein